MSQTCRKCKIYKRNVYMIYRDSNLNVSETEGFIAYDENSKQWRQLGVCKRHCPYELERLMEQSL